MKGLLAKEWCVILKTSVSTFILLLLFAVMGVFNRTTYMFAYIAVFLGVIPVNYIAFDESSRWQQYALALPYKRSTIVSAKYIVMLMLEAAAAAVTAVGLFFNMQRAGTFTIEHFTLYLTTTFAAGILLPSVAFPFNFKFGTAKGRLIKVIAACLLASFLSMWLLGHTENIPLNTTPLVGELHTYAAIPIILLATAVICVISWFISVQVYEHKDL